MTSTNSTGRKIAENAYNGKTKVGRRAGLYRAGLCTVGSNGVWGQIILCGGGCPILVGCLVTSLDSAP